MLFYSVKSLWNPLKSVRCYKQLMFYGSSLNKTYVLDVYTIQTKSNKLNTYFLKLVNNNLIKKNNVKKF